MTKWRHNVQRPAVSDRRPVWGIRDWDGDGEHALIGVTGPFSSPYRERSAGRYQPPHVLRNHYRNNGLTAVALEISRSTIHRALPSFLFSLPSCFAVGMRRRSGLRGVGLDAHAHVEAGRM